MYSGHVLCFFCYLILRDPVLETYFWSLQGTLLGLLLDPLGFNLKAFGVPSGMLGDPLWAPFWTALDSLGHPWDSLGPL